MLKDFLDHFDPIIFSITFWQTFVTNWWYNVGRDFVKEYFILSKKWYDNML